jgi:molecular chaperone HscB
LDILEIVTDPTLDTLRRATNHFAVFGLPLRYAMDAAELERRYVLLTRMTHPDLAGPDPEAQLEAMDLSARVNSAHAVLVDEEQRANYLLELLGGPASSQDKSLPEGFLPIIMMTREELAEAQLEGDEGRVAAIESDARAQRAARLSLIVARFERADLAADKAALGALRTELNALRYYQRLLEQTDPEYRPPL